MTTYWSIGINSMGASNINIDNVTYLALPSSQAGTGIHFAGYAAGAGYAVVLNVSNSMFEGCNVVISFDDYAQGVALNNDNVTACNYGVSVISDPIALLTGLQVTGGQYYAYICIICVSDANFEGLQVANAAMIVKSEGIKVEGGQYEITGNNIATMTGTTTCIEIANIPSVTQGGTISNNALIGCTSGIKIDSGLNTTSVINYNHFNPVSASNYVIGASSVNTIINDSEVRIFTNLPTCTNSISYSKFTIADSSTSTFNSSITSGGGANIGTAICSGANYTFH